MRNTFVKSGAQPTYYVMQGMREGWRWWQREQWRKGNQFAYRYY